MKQVVITRADLKMRRGKEAMQAAHAVGEIIAENIDHPYLVEWRAGNRAKINVSVSSEAELLALHEKAKAAGLMTFLQIDAGRTEFKGVETPTAVAIGPAPAELIDPITGDLPLR